MRLRFLIDAQLPPLLARTLKKARHEALHVYQVAHLSSRDSDIWAYARQKDFVLLTKDEDFAVLRRGAKAGPAVVWLRMGNITNDILAARLLAALPQIVAAIENGETLIEVR